MLRRIASCLLVALAAGAMPCHASQRMKVQVVQTHTGIKLAAASPADAADTDPTMTRCSGDSGAYAKDMGFYCHDSVVPVDVGPGDRASSLFFDISVIMPDAARLVFHCSTVLDPGCEAFPVYPRSASVVCSDFVYDGSAYKDCTASGSAAGGIGVYEAALHGDRMTIFGEHWQRHYHKYGTWEYPDPPVRRETALMADPRPVVAQDPRAVAVQDPRPVSGPGPEQASPSDPDPAPAQLVGPVIPEAATFPVQQETPAATQPETKPPQEAKPPADAAAVPPPDHAPPAGVAPPSAADQVIDPRIIEQAKAGDPVSQYKLGYDYFLGRGVPMDYVQAAVWWKKAADQGYPQAQNNLGVLYNAGKGVPQSYAEAYFWQNLAAARSSGTLQAQFAKNRDESASKLWFMARLKVQQRAAKWAAEHPVPPRSQEPRETKQ